MSKDTKEPDLSPNNKATTSSDHGKNPRATFSSSSSSSSALWFRLKDPRIARVSRAFGGKDRHSKVCTIKGLRDRRVRLSVPTAIQLYDLQDRLGLSQPSKVIDWLLEAAKHEIDELPPLPEPEIPIGNLSQLMHHQSKDAVGETEDHDVLHTVQPHDSSLNYLHSHFEPPNVPSAHTLHGFIPQHDQSARDNGNLSAFSSTLSLSSGSPFSVYQPSRTQAYYAHHLGTPLEIDPRNVNSFHIPTSTSSQSIFSSSPTAMPPFSGTPLRPLHLSLNYPKFPSQNSFQAQPSKD